MTSVTISVNGFKSEIGKNSDKKSIVNPDDFGEKTSNKNDVETSAKACGAALNIVGIPPGTSKDFIEKFLRDKIPNAGDISVPIDRVSGTTHGSAIVQFSPGVNVKDVLKQVKGLQMGVRRLTIADTSSGGDGFGDGHCSGGGFGGGKSGGGFGGSNSGGGGPALFVGGLPYGVSEDDVRNFLQEKIPGASNVRVPFDREKNSIKGFAFVELGSGADVNSVISQVANLELGGRTLKINESKPKGGRPSGGGGGFGGDNSRGFGGRNSGGGGFGRGNSDRGGFDDSRRGHHLFPTGRRTDSESSDSESSDDELMTMSALPYDWHSEDVVAEILSSHQNANRREICVIKCVSWTKCSVWIISTHETMNVDHEDLKPVQPRKNDKVS